MVAQGSSPPAFTAHDLMREILRMTTQRFTEPDRFNALATRAGIHAVDARIYFLTQLRERVRMIPLKLFAGTEARDRMLESLQTALDNEIAREEVA